MVSLERGQLTYCGRYLAGRGHASDKAVQRFLARLERDGSVTTQTATGSNRHNHLQLRGKYQRRNFRGQQTARQRPQRATNGPEEGNIKALEIISPSGSDEPEGFGPWYAAYPKHVIGSDAAKSFVRLMRSGAISLEALMAATARYAAKVANTEKRFIKAPCGLDQ